MQRKMKPMFWDIESSCAHQTLRRAPTPQVGEEVNLERCQKLYKHYSFLSVTTNSFLGSFPSSNSSTVSIL